MANNEQIHPTPPDEDRQKKPSLDESQEDQNKSSPDLENHKNKDTLSEDSEALSSTNQPEENSDGLTDDQEAALQRIMAEIEATSASKSTESTPATSITADQEETLNKIVAELQGDIPSEDSNTSNKNKTEKQPEAVQNSDEPVSEDLTPEQEEALQKIMAEIGDSSPKADDTKENEPEKSAPPLDQLSNSEPEDSVQQSEQPSGIEPEDSAQQSEQSSGSEPEKKIESEEDRSSDNDKFEELALSDFESELKKVVTEAKTQPTQTSIPLKDSNLNDAKASSPSTVEKKSETAATKASEPPPVTSAQPASQKASSDKPVIKPADHANDQLEEKKSEEVTSSPLDQHSQKPPIETSDETNTDTEAPVRAKPKIKPLEEPPTSKKKLKFNYKKTLIAGCTTIMVIFMVVLAIKWLPYISGHKVKKEALAVIDESQPAGTIKDQNIDQNAPAPASLESNLKETQNDTLSKILSDIQSDRMTLLNKLKEISDLKKYYTQGIIEVEDDLIDLIRSKKLTLLQDALLDQKVELGLRTIQRRKNYISKLDLPFDQLFTASEELLYLERKANILRELMQNTSGITLDRFKKQIAETIERINQTKANLAIDQSAPPVVSLETIWDDLLKRLKSEASGQTTSLAQVQQNQRIWKDICAGNYDQKWALTDLNEKAADCLLKFKGKDLYLNGLTTITPKVAQILSKWPGEWLGLNGLSSLSPEVASHLAHWKGKRLSLNGLLELTPKATLYLSKWQGDQLELVGLKHIGQWENPKIKLFISDRLRNQIPK